MRKKFTPGVIAIFIILSAALFALNKFDTRFSLTPLLTANALMAGLTLASFFMVISKLDSKPHAFVGGVQAARFVKLIITVAAVVGYAYAYKATVYKPMLWVFMGIYIAYTFFETALLAKISRERTM